MQLKSIHISWAPLSNSQIFWSRLIFIFIWEIDKYKDGAGDCLWSPVVDVGLWFDRINQSCSWLKAIQYWNVWLDTQWTYEIWSDSFTWDRVGDTIFRNKKGCSEGDQNALSHITRIVIINTNKFIHKGQKTWNSEHEQKPL